MMKKTLFPAIFLVLLLLSACDEQVHENGSGTITTETRNVGAFSELEVEGEYEIVLQEGPHSLVTIVTDENLHQYIETVVEGNTLKIKEIEEVEASEETKLLITYQDLRGIKIGGAATVSNEGILKA